MIMVDFDRSLRTTPSPHYMHTPHSQHHLAQPNHSKPSTPSPPFSYAPLPQMNPRQQQQMRPSYPPQGYPQPQMAYYTPMDGRQSPHYSQPAVPLPQVSLPPMRINPPQQLPPPSMGQMGSPLPPPNPLPYYTPLPPPGAQHITSSPMHPNMRYQMGPMPQERIMSGGRHKKEIKRRTKTGCLTCRKRRIKCDEGHPTCKNCQKSKRECMGYDPIFKSQQQQQQQQQQTPLQPAQQMGMTSAPQQASQIPTSMPYAVAQQQVPYVQSLSTAGNSPASSVEPYEYSIDPALEAVVTSQPIQPGMMAETQPNMYRDLKRSYDRISPFSGVDPMLNGQLMPANPAARSPPYLEDPNLLGSSAKRIKIDDLLSAHRGHALQSRAAMAHLPSPPTTDPNVPMDTRTLYETEYAPSLDELLETKWFSTRGLEKMAQEGGFYEAVTSLFTKLRLRGGTYLEETDPTLKAEEDTEVFWKSMEIIFGVKAEREQEANESAEKEVDEYNYDIQQTLMKLQVIQALLTRKPATIARVKTPRSSPSGEPNGTSESNFWDCLREFVGHPIVNISEMHEVNKYLVNMHSKLTNTDVTRHILASIAEESFLSKRLELEPNSSGTKAIKERIGLIRQYIEGIARAPPQNYNGIIRRICGRTVGLWSGGVETSIAV